MPVYSDGSGCYDGFGNTIGTVTEVKILKAPKGTKVSVEGLGSDVKIVDLTREKPKIGERIKLFLRGKEK